MRVEPIRPCPTREKGRPRAWLPVILCGLAALGCAGRRAQEPAQVSEGETGRLEGHVSIGPLRPVQRLDQPPPSVPPEAYASRPIVILASDGTTEVKRVKIDPDGTYRVSLPAGSYVVDIARTSRIERARPLPRPVTIVKGQTVRLDIDIDTGLR